MIIQLGDIGDVVWTLPALAAIRKAWPGVELSVLLRAGSASLLDAEILPPKTFEVPQSGKSLVKDLISSFSLISSLRREHFDLVFDFRADERGGYMAFLTGSPRRAALYYPSMRGLRNHLFTHLVGWNGKPLAVGAADQSLYILRAFGIETEDAVPRLNLSEGARRRAADIIASLGLPVFLGEAGFSAAVAVGGSAVKSWITLNPFSRWSYKEWGAEKWVRIIDWLYAEYKIKVVIIGSSGEKKRAEAIVAACPGRAFSIAGATTLAELAGVLSCSRLHVGVDSAAPHIAAAVGTPTVTIYGPSDWRYWTPPGKNNRVVVSGMSCAPCSLKGCNGGGKSLCLENMELGKVQDVIREALLADGESSEGEKECWRCKVGTTRQTS
ncbi:MAG: glycosyltransferase family 9 protein [Syntrophales bacterium]|nr:glycosyltransferase family 9 protein [Syntrophales bacterium]